MPSYLVKVRKKMDIFAQRRVRNVLSGNYGSVFKGRSLDFDDLREYNYGDDVKDIDWKANLKHRVGGRITIRLSIIELHLLVKRKRRQTILRQI